MCVRVRACVCVWEREGRGGECVGGGGGGGASRNAVRSYCSTNLSV